MAQQKRKWSVGDLAWQGMLVRDGREDGDSATEFCETFDEAKEQASETLGHLSEWEQAGAEIAVRQYRILSLNEDGTPGDIERA